MPALRMGDGDPAKHFGDFAVLSWPKQEMPVIRHQAMGGDADPRVTMCLRQNLFEGDIVCSCLKQRQPSHATVQDVIGEVTSSKSGAAWHGDSCSGSLVVNTPDPFSLLTEELTGVLRFLQILICATRGDFSRAEPRRELNVVPARTATLQESNRSCPSSPSACSGAPRDSAPSAEHAPSGPRQTRPRASYRH